MYAKHLCECLCTMVQFYPHHTLSYPIRCDQRLHFGCVSCHAKRSRCQQLFKSICKSEQINLKNRFFSALDQFRAFAWVLCNRLELLQFFYSHETRAIWRQILRLIFSRIARWNFVHAWYKVERLSAEVTLRMPAHTEKTLPLLAGYIPNWQWY